MTLDVEKSVEFYVSHLGFELEWKQPPAFGAIKLGALRILLSGPGSSGAKPMPDGSTPIPGGWNRIQVFVDDIAEKVQVLRAAGCQFRGEIVKGVGGSQIILDDPSGNPIELWQSA